MEVMEKGWTTSDVDKLFKISDRVKSPKTLVNAEERGEIPTASRVLRGKIPVRQWALPQLPAIGERFGFLSKPISQKVICIYTPKGGVLKTSLCYNMARMLALNGIKTLIAGQDFHH
jgi:chromosome partitioning protein